MMNLNSILIGLGAAVAAGIAGFMTWLMIANAHLKTDLATARAEAAICRLTNAQFQIMAAKQSAAIARLAAETQAREQHAAAAMREASTLAATYRAKAEQLMRQQPTDESCRAAERLFEGYLEPTGR